MLEGNAERDVVVIAHRLGRGEPIENITDGRSTAFVGECDRESSRDWFEIDSTEVGVAGVFVGDERALRQLCAAGPAGESVMARMTPA